MTAKDAEELATELGIHHLVVVDERRRPRGVLCLCDLWGTGPQVDVSDVMTSPPDVIDAAMPARALVQRVSQLHRGCIPVVNREQVVGVVTRGDLRRAGLLSEADCPRCALCGTFHHVRINATSHEPVCLECEESGRPWEGDAEAVEYGGGD